MNKRDSSKKSLTEWARVDAMKDEEIDYSDIPELDEEFWQNAQVIYPARKQRLPQVTP